MTLFFSDTLQGRSEDQPRFLMLPLDWEAALTDTLYAYSFLME